jgi:hypothetical protein
MPDGRAPRGGTHPRCAVGIRLRAFRRDLRAFRPIARAFKIDSRRAFHPALTVCALLAASTALRAQLPQPDTLTLTLARAATFVERYAARTSGLVIEESYVQDVQQVNRFGFRVNQRSGATHRELKADLLLVRVPGTDAWMQFRDVFEVDGRKLRDRTDRLQKLFLQPSKNTQAQADKIVKESARYNIGDVERTINIPMLGLTVLDRSAQSGFEFKLDDTRDANADIFAVPKTADFAVPAGAIAVAFRETAIQTMVKTPQGKNLAAKGRFWFDAASGNVLMTELRIEEWTLAAAVHVAYRQLGDIDLPMPAAMHEMYENRLNNRRVEGTARYSNPRQFNVNVDEKMVPLSEQR